MNNCQALQSKAISTITEALLTMASIPTINLLVVGKDQNKKIIFVPYLLLIIPDPFNCFLLKALF